MNTLTWQVVENWSRMVVWTSVACGALLTVWVALDTVAACVRWRRSRVIQRDLDHGVRLREVDALRRLTEDARAREARMLRVVNGGRA